MSSKKERTILVGNTSEPTHGFSGAMLVFKGVEISIFLGILLSSTAALRFITQLLLQGMLMLLESEVKRPVSWEVFFFQEIEMDLGSGTRNKTTIFNGKI